MKRLLLLALIGVCLMLVSCATNKAIVDLAPESVAGKNIVFYQKESQMRYKYYNEANTWSEWLPYDYPYCDSFSFSFPLNNSFKDGLNLKYTVTYKKTSRNKAEITRISDYYQDREVYNLTFTSNGCGKADSIRKYPEGTEMQRNMSFKIE